MLWLGCWARVMVRDKYFSCWSEMVEWSGVGWVGVAFVDTVVSCSWSSGWMGWCSGGVWCCTRVYMYDES